MNILIAPNGFKECAESVDIATSLAEYLTDQNLLNLLIKPITDGGDGFQAVCELLFDVKQLTYCIKRNYDDQLFNYKLLYNELEGKIYIESAELFGIRSVPKSNLNPLSLNSETLGIVLLMLKEDVEKGKLKVQQVNIGVGGTATIDLGIGACSHLGLTLFDDRGNKLNPIPENFIKVRSYKFSPVNLPFKISFIVDVDTPLLDEPGAIEIYGKQKGAKGNDLSLIRNGIVNLLKLFSNNSLLNIPSKLNGAGGGVASGFSIFYKSEIIPARDFIRKTILNNINSDQIDVVITGEGKFDFQSFEGKGIGILLEIFKDKNIPIFIICGSAEINNKINLPKNIRVIELQTFFYNEIESIKNIKIGLGKASQLIINELFH